MPRHKLTLRERLAGVEKSVKSKHTPPKLISGLRRYAHRLRNELRARSRHRN
jgi:hypothetical protein